MRRVVTMMLAATLWSTSAFAQEPTPSLPPPPPDRWWHTYHLVDYSLIAAGATAYLTAGSFAPRERALLGPEFDPDDPTAVFDPAHADRIGRLHVEEGTQETVPVPHLIGIAGAMGGLIALQEGALWAWSDRGSAEMFHEVFVGYAEAQALTGGLTEISKVFVGRLRPDYQDRAARHLCNTEPPDGFDCAPYEGRPLASDADEAEHIFADGRKSFWSGHSAFSFSTFTYATLVTGGRWVWGADATPTSRAFGILAQMAFMGSALFITGSRLDDGRHHVTDVLVGSAAGFGLASFSYWRRFDASGRVIRGQPKTALRLQPGPASGLSLVLEH